MNPSDIRKKAEKIVDMFLKPSLKSVERIMDRAALGLVIETSLLEMYSVGKDDGEQAGFERAKQEIWDKIQDHYWDSLDQDIVLTHLKAILFLLQKDK